MNAIEELLSGTIGQGLSDDGTVFGRYMGRFRDVFAGFPDPRTGKNRQFSMLELAGAAFGVFFTQCPSFLAYQRTMEDTRGQSNARSVFGLGRIPTDNCIRTALDAVPPSALHPAFKALHAEFRAGGGEAGCHGVGGLRIVALDGTRHHSSEKVHCANCTHSTHSRAGGGERVVHSHCSVTPVLVDKGAKTVFPLAPEFIVPQDGSEKQDCELAASQRWLERSADVLGEEPTVLLGDDLYAHSPFCRKTVAARAHFLFTCKRPSHKALHEYVDGFGPDSPLMGRVAGVGDDGRGHRMSWTVRYVNAVPLTDEDGAMRVGWLELTETDGKGRQTYQCAWITDLSIDDVNAIEMAATARARWDIENGNNNILKTKGYHFEHNFGHGKAHLSNLLASMNILAFGFHELLRREDARCRMVRAKLVRRDTFFQDIAALMRYGHFASWAALMDFMMRGLEIGPYEPPQQLKTPRRIRAEARKKR